MKKLLSLLIMLALAVGLCSGYALAAEGGELYIDWAPDSLGDDPNAPEYSNVYTEPAGPSEEEYAAAREALLLMLEEEGIPSDEIDLDAYLAEMMPMTAAEPATPEVTTPSTRRANESGATAASSHYFTEEAFLVPISDQGSRSTCWAIAAIDSLRIGAQKDNITVPALSADHLAHYAYAGFTDKHNAEADSIDPTTELGNVYASLMTLASAVGPAASLDTSKTEINYADNQLWLKNGRWLRLSGSEDRTAVKQAVFDNGAVALSLCLNSRLASNTDYYNSATHAYYYCPTDVPVTTDHEVVIVGWDDDYSAENFSTAPTDADGKALNGAWLCRNSWGKTWGDVGYFWVSYYDKSLYGDGTNSGPSMAVSFDASAWDKSLNVYQYDCNYTFNSMESTDQTVTIANVYTADADEKLTTVGSYSLMNSADYTVTVYTGLTDAAKPDSGTKAAEEIGLFSSAGYQTHTLNSAVYLKKGETFAVVYTFTFSATSGQIPVCKQNSLSGTVNGEKTTFTATNHSNAGESFLLSSSGWTDVSVSTGGSTNYRIKAFTLPHAHTWNSGTEEKAASCTEDGSTLYTCTACGATKSEPIAAAHTLTHVEAKAATATDDGNTEYWKCSVCSACFSDAAGKTAIKQSDTVIAVVHKIEHIEAKAATATKPGNTEYWKCADCGQCYADADGKTKIDETGTVIAAKGFDDVKPTTTYHDSVIWAVENGVTTGATDTTFDPTGYCTRAQLVTFLWRAAGEPEPTTTVCPFTDVNPTRYYYKAVLWAAENGIVKGITDTTFFPTLVCTRAQTVTFLWRAAGEPEPTGTTCPFTDVTDDYYYDAVLWAVENDIAKGITTTSFSPFRVCTRSNAVTFLCRAYKDK